MKIKVEEEFRYEGTLHKNGEVVDLPESVAESIIDKGYGHKEGDTPEISSKEEAPEVGGSPEIQPLNDEAIFDKVKEDLDGELTSSVDKWNPSQEDPPEPSEHPDLHGKIIRVDVNKEYGSRFATVETEEGYKALYEHTVLDNLFDAISEGDYLGVRYVGQPEGKNYLNYKYTLYSPEGKKKISNTG